MTLKQAIVEADKLRPNAVPDALKAAWIFELEADLAEMMEVDEPKNTWPESDSVLLMPDGHNSMYYLYLMAMIDNANEETALYANDMAVAQNAIDEARAWWWKNHYTRKANMIKVM